MEKILIVRLSAMGDIVHSLPVVAALRNTKPDATIDWVIEEHWAELLAAHDSPFHGQTNTQKPLVNAIHLVNTRRWRDHPLAGDTRREIFNLRHVLCHQHYETVIDVQGAIRSAVIARFSKAPHIVGFSAPREAQAKYFYSDRVLARGTHIIEQNVSLTGLPVPAPHADMLPQDPAAEQWCSGELTRLQLSGKYAVLSPGAGWGAKEWSPQRYGEVAAMLAKDGVISLINCGPRESALAESVESTSGGAAKRVACSVGQLIALLKKSAVFVGGDTGPMHLANLIGVPVVAVFGPTDPARNGPFYPPFEVVRHESSRTDYSHRSREHEGLMNTTSQEVYEAARRLLDR